MPNYYEMLSGYLDGISEDCDLIEEAIVSLENHFQYMNNDDLLHFSRPLAIAYLALKQVKNARPNKTVTTSRRDWCNNIAEIEYYLYGHHDFPGVSDDLQEKWAALENAESIISISWDAKEERYLVVFRQNREK